MLIKKIVSIMATGLIAAAPFSASAGPEAGDIVGKVGGAYLIPNSPSPKFDTVAFKLKKDKNPFTVSFDVLAMVTSGLGVNFGMTIPASVQQTGRTLNDDARAEVNFDLMPLHAALQYYFLSPQDEFRPYVGAGLHYTRIGKVKVGHQNVKKADFDDSFGVLFQGGGVFTINDDMFVDLSARYFYLEPNGKMKALIGSGKNEKHVRAKVKKFNLTPWMFNVSMGFKF